MPLAAGRRLGPYEILNPIGAGGMGEVYRARDTRLGREVALKVLPPQYASDAERRLRFDQEARVVASLDHPNILALHDVGTEDGVSYAIFELLKGETLRERLERGALPVRKAVECGVQICRGLAAAHGGGIAHRDLKPENLAFAADGSIKILDFGLARLTGGDSAPDLESAETQTATAAGVVLGTPAYMSPEQARARPADARSDLFSLGAILYEMVTGRRAFEGASSADTLSAILHHDPPEMTAGQEPVPGGLKHIVRRCLEKEPEERFQSARDLAFALESLSGPLLPSAPIPPPSRRGRWLAASATAVAVFATAAWLWTARSEPRLPDMRQLTFRRGMILDARFTADGNTVAYSALFDGNPAETYSVRLDGPEALPLALAPSHLMGISSTGEMAVVLGRPGERRAEWVGTLARMPLSGGAPREVLDDVFWADWSPDGHDLAVVRSVSGQLQLEYPIGTLLQRPLAERGSAAFEMRVSPRGDRVAYAASDGVVVVDRGGKVTILESNPPVGLAWDPAGDAVWTLARYAGQTGSDLLRLGIDGRSRRTVARFAGVVMLLDVSRDGRFLVHTGFERQGIRARARGQSAERDLGVYATSWVGGLSGDGRQLVIWDYSDAGPSGLGRVFLRSMLGGPPVRVAEGFAVGLSEDARSVLLTRPSKGQDTLVVVPTGAGTPKILATAGLRDFGQSFTEYVGGASFVDDGHVVVDATSEGGRPRSYLLDIGAGTHTPITPEGTFAVHRTATGGEILGADAEGKLSWHSLRGGPSRTVVARLPPGVAAIGAAGDEKGSLYVFEDGVPGRVDRLDLATGRRTPWKVLMPDDPAGVVLIYPPLVTRDGSAYAYTYARYLQDLYLVEGLR